MRTKMSEVNLPMLRGISRTLAFGAVATAALLLASCESMPTKGQQLIDVSGLGGNKIGEIPPAPSARQWPDAAQDVIDQRARGYGLVQMPQMQAYLNGLLAKIKQVSGVPDWQGAVYITAVSGLDAYSTAAGNIYISWAWLESIESEDEIVAILSHEFGHIFLDAHQIEGAINTSNQTAKWAALALAIGKKVGTSTGWTPVDSLILAYDAGKNTLAPAWGRKEEELADRFGATVSLKLDYSFPRGFKTFLERQASWEAKSLVEQKVQNSPSTTAATTNLTANTLPDLQANFSESTSQALQNVSSAFKKAVKPLTNTHPDTEDRLKLLTAQVMPLMEGKPRPPATVAPWESARAQSQTAATLKHYRLVVEAQTALDNKDLINARTLALAASAAPTEHHALPVMLLSFTGGATMPIAAAPVAKRKGKPSQPNQPVEILPPLERNLRSEPDRAWRIYPLRATQLLEAGQTSQATEVMRNGMDYFGNSPNAWPDAIAFVARTKGWPEAKRLAQQCANRFESFGSICAEAAQSPQDLADQKRRNEEKTKGIVDKWTNKLK